MSLMSFSIPISLFFKFIGWILGDGPVSIGVCE